LRGSVEDGKILSLIWLWFDCNTLGVALLGMRCTAWLLSMVEEVLRNPGIEDFVKSSFGEVRIGLVGSWR